MDAPEEEEEEEGHDGNGGSSKGQRSAEVKMALQHRGHTTVPSWVHRANLSHRGSSGQDTYDAQHRNPLHCRADTECVWELERLAEHYHPSVALFANSLLKVIISRQDSLNSGYESYFVMYAAALQTTGESLGKTYFNE